VEVVDQGEPLEDGSPQLGVRRCDRGRARAGLELHEDFVSSVLRPENASAHANFMAVYDSKILLKNRKSIAFAELLPRRT
jgi:hypothetical protein